MVWADQSISSSTDLTAFDGIELSKGVPGADMWGRFGSCKGGGRWRSVTSCYRNIAAAAVVDAPYGYVPAPGRGHEARVRLRCAAGLQESGGALPFPRPTHKTT